MFGELVNAHELRGLFHPLRVGPAGRRWAGVHRSLLGRGAVDGAEAAPYVAEGVLVIADPGDLELVDVDRAVVVGVGTGEPVLVALPVAHTFSVTEGPDI